MAHPYANLPNSAFWKKSVAGVSAESFDPMLQTKFSLNKQDKIATAGSCFAQNISQYLSTLEFNYFQVESAHPLMPPDLAAEYQYGTYSARFGNIYTSRQLLQLFDRAYGRFSPDEGDWRRPDGKFVDPFRPQISPDGYVSREELRADRAFHLARVRAMFEQLDVFVFTLGLTECFVSRSDGAVFPVCPGVSGGEFDELKYKFVNLRAQQVVDDLEAFLSRLRSVNARARVILTVSPVPLVATAAQKHVAVATSYSKSALRVACEEIVASHPHVEYFPSLEIITGAHARGRYFAPNLRTVTKVGVDHVMRVFMKHFAGANSLVPLASLPVAPVVLVEEDGADLVDIICDEEILNKYAVD